MGADMVELTMTAAGYPQQLLRDQIRQLGVFLNGDPRGVQIWDYVLDPSNPTAHFTKATFAVDGVIDRQQGSVRLNPFAKAFAGAKTPWTVHSMELQFQGEVPTNRMIQVWRGQGAVVEGRFETSKDPRLAGIEFRIQLLTQDPAKMDIPEPGDAPKTQPKKPLRQTGSDWMTIGVFIVAAAAIGALVYSLLLRGRPKARI